jgi:hypothetical protein
MGVGILLFVVFAIGGRRGHGHLGHEALLHVFSPREGVSVAEFLLESGRHHDRGGVDGIASVELEEGKVLEHLRCTPGGEQLFVVFVGEERLESVDLFVVLPHELRGVQDEESIDHSVLHALGELGEGVLLLVVFLDVLEDWGNEAPSDDNTSQKESDEEQLFHGAFLSRKWNLHLGRHYHFCRKSQVLTLPNC